jgi:hypothetical protein
MSYDTVDANQTSGKWGCWTGAGGYQGESWWVGKEMLGKFDEKMQGVVVQGVAVQWGVE